MHGLSTLNRLLGKKNKEASRSTINLSNSTSNLDTSSQHNKISPIVNNAPFEQTFRVTVYLPKKQLYVERIGAKTKLATLMDRICENKHLSPDKYEFRHPGDMSQAFDIDKTIGEVGLNELQLVLKTESRYTNDFRRFHADDIVKYKSSVPDSVSSSETSRNYSKNVLQKASPYSSTTSLNSLDSTGMNLTAKTQTPVVPARKKRAAPRPPSQNSIPEQEIFGTTLNVFKEPHSILPRKNFHVSSPQLFQNNVANSKTTITTINNNNISSQQDVRSDKNNNIETGNRLNAITRPTSLYVTNTTEIDQNGSAGRQRSPSESSEIQQILHERRDSNSLEKKKKPAPVPPKRTHRPIPSPRTVQEDVKSSTITEIKEIDEVENLPRLDDKVNDQSASGNVSKTMLNNIPPSEEFPNVESSDGPISIQIVSSDNSIEFAKDEAVSSPKLPAVSKVHIKPEEERRSSSEDEMTVNIYNVTKSVVTLEKQNHVTVTEQVMEVKQETEVKKPVESRANTVEVKKSITEVRHEEEEVRAPSPLWTYTLPAPPVFADSNVGEKTSPTDQQKHGEKYFTDFASTDCNETILSDSNTTVISAETQIHPIIVDRKLREDSFIISPKYDTKPVANDDESDKSTEIITSDLEDGYLGNGNGVTVDSPSPNVSPPIETSPTPIVINHHVALEPVVPVVQSKRLDKEIVVEDFQRSRLLISRSDSFHSIGQARNFDNGVKRGPLKAAQRSTSFLSLVQSQKAEALLNKSSSDTAPYSRQKSTSELSISDSPSLQSVEVMKNILNSSRKSSLQDSLVKEEKADVKRQEVIVEVEKKKEEIIKPKLKEVSRSQKEEPLKPQPKVEKVPDRQLSEPVVEVKPVETQWRYSGPPKINLSTWNERPKVEVAIAADSDYKFGGVTATLPRDFRNSLERNSEATPNKRHTVHISNDHVANDITSREESEKFTKPKVLGVEYKKDVIVRDTFRDTPTENGYKPVILRDSSAEIIKKPSRTIINITPRPMSMDMSNSYSTIVTSTTPSLVSFNRLNSNPKKFTPVVHGFKLNNIKEGERTETSTTAFIKKEAEISEHKKTPPSVPTKPAFLRSTSSGDIKRNMKFSAVEKSPDDETDNRFSQFGLRKTGLKEKILQNDKNTKSIFGKVVEPKEETFVRSHNQENHVARSLSQPVPPKPPTAPPPPMTFRKSEPLSIETRDQLLDAIKNFKKDSLRHK